jgi:hypothetical protein
VLNRALSGGAALLGQGAMITHDLLAATSRRALHLVFIAGALLHCWQG